MNRRLNDLHLQRGRLLERITTQRILLNNAMPPVQHALHTTDRVLACAQAGMAYIKRHPAIVTLAVATLFIFRIKRIVHLARKGFLLWKTWQALRNRLIGLRMQA